MTVETAITAVDVQAYAAMRYGQEEERFARYLTDLRAVVDEPVATLLTGEWDETTGDRRPVAFLTEWAGVVDQARREAVWWRRVAFGLESETVERWRTARREALDAVLGADRMDAAYLAARQFVNLSTADYVSWWARGMPEDERVS